jgi:hypothetical protein
MYTTGQYLKIVEGKGGGGGGGPHPRPQPCAPIPCQNMHTVPEYDEAIIDQYWHQSYH